MSEETKPVEEVTEQVPEQKPLALGDLKCGYVVGMTEEGDFVFDLVGKTKGLVELLGLHAFAQHKVSQVTEANQGSGDALVHELGRMVHALSDQVTQLQKNLKKPDNSL